ncbi:CopA family copper-resistance protein [Acinetobacter calcoaceticus]|uniref:CopA family copper-resistance protein n=1 Tax=Acinetobacter calcoaceticus TaxID=471 RepID=A0A4R1XBP8_ACICA|nr:CopA family copper-resistance protein [Acinetobacter calcoaceticus]
MSILMKKLSPHVVVAICMLSSSWSYGAVREYQLTIEENMVNVTGKPLKRITVNGQFPAPLLEFEEGDEAVIRVRNHLNKQDSSVHWHGLLLPGLMDGVPGFNQYQGIKPQSEFIYRFKVRQNGTYWYHAHSKGQEQDGLYGSLVIYPKGKMPLVEHEKAQQDYVVMLSDFHESSSDQIMKNLKQSAEYYQTRRETVFDAWKQVQQDGLKATWQQRRMWNQMRMARTDMSDVTGYTFLVNGNTPQQNWTGVFKPNEKVRLRFINASAMSFFDVNIPNLKMTVIAADGQAVKPVLVDEFRIGTAETYDVIVEPKAERYQIQAESIDRTGFAIGSIQNQALPHNNTIQIPPARPRAVLTMADMGHGGGGDRRGGHAGMDHSQMQAVDTSDHSQMQAVDTSDHSKMQGMDHSKMQGMDHSKMQAQAQKPATTMQANSKQTVLGWANASTPAGHKALQYSDLKSLTPQKDNRPAEREIEVRLGGTMERYIWTINGKKFTEVEPLQVKYGERIRLKFINDSMMAHPMHLHGMFMQLENGQNSEDLPNKHTLVVPPGKTVTALLTADEIGEWAIHCHLLYHMSAGMMSKLIVAKVDESTPKSQVKSQLVPVQQGAQHAHH